MTGPIELRLELSGWFGPWVELYAERIEVPDLEFVKFMLRCALRVTW